MDDDDSPKPTHGSAVYQSCFAFIAGMATMTSGAWLAWPATAIVPDKELTQGFKVTSSEIFTLTTLMDVGDIVSPIPSSYAMDIVGRRFTLLSTAVLFIASSVCALVAYNVYWLYVAKIFAGLAKGIAFAVIPIYLAEVANTETRGALSTMFIGFFNFGMLYDHALAQFVELRMLNFANLAIPLVFTITFWLFPESPYYFLMRGNALSAKKSLAAFRHVKQNDTAANTALDKELTTIDKDLKNESRFFDLFSTATNRRALLIISVLAICQRSTGISPTLTYSTQIMPKEGGGASSNVYMVIFNFALVVGNYITLPLIDRWGRKPLLIVSCISTGLTTLTVSIYYYLERETDVDVTNIQWIPYACLITFAITYSIGIGLIPSTLVGELFPANVKSYASSISTIILTITSFSVNKLFYDVAMHYGPCYMYWYFTLACFACLLFTKCLLFETKGKSFAEIQDILQQSVAREATLEESSSSSCEC